MERKSSRRGHATQPTPESGRRGARKTQSQDATKTKGQKGATQKKQRSMTQYLEDAGESPSQKVSKVPPISADQVLEEARKVVYFLVACATDGSAINRSDIQKTVLNNFHPKHYPTIMTKAAEVLKDVFAMEMKNLDGNDEKFDKLILVDKHSIPKPVDDDEDKATQTLLLLVLNCIEIAGGRILEEQLLNFLRELNISYSKNDPHFGDVEAKMNAFRSQAYLKIETDNSTAPPTKSYILGARAEPEINKLQMMTFSKKLYPDLAFLHDAAEELMLANETEEDDAGTDD